MTDTLPPSPTRAKMGAANGTPAPTEQARAEPQTLPAAEEGQKSSMYTRTPSKTPVLRPENRYCQKDGFLKPYRTHHCRACGSVSVGVMQMRTTWNDTDAPFDSAS